MLIVITPDVSWLRSLFEAMPVDIDVAFINVHNLRERWRWPTYPWRTIGRWRRLRDNIEQLDLNLPIIFPRLSRWIVWFFIRRAVSRQGRRNARGRRHFTPTIVYVYPWHATLAKRSPDFRAAYLAHDPFVFYQCWNPVIVVKQERQLLESCDHVFAITRELANDFQQIEGLKATVALARNGVDAIRTTEPRPGRPSDLPLGRPIVGCVGQINDTFDWEWIEKLTESNPSYQFVFIGNLVETNPLLASLIERRLRRGKILWMGGRPHAELPAYIAHFDVCLCPLRKSDHNDRRCPLRFFDYFAAGRPILTTPIGEAFAHRPYLNIAETVDQASAILTGLANGSIHHDASAMRCYATQNTWNVRADQFLAALGVMTPSPKTVATPA